jgi:hydrogenase nickel incorporation protein HypA/HybF
MHEWALAEAVITAASEVAEKEGLREVTEVRIGVGELQQVDQEVFEFALSQLKKDEFKGAKFKIEKVRAKLSCRGCSHTWTFASESLDESAKEAIHFVPEVAHAYLKCPRCGSPDFEVLEGRGIWLLSVKGVKQA